MKRKFLEHVKAQAEFDEWMNAQLEFSKTMKKILVLLDVAEKQAPTDTGHECILTCLSQVGMLNAGVEGLLSAALYSSKLKETR